MIKKTITYEDYNGVERTEDFYFHLTKAELTKMQMGVRGGFIEMVNRIIAAQDSPAIIEVFEDLIQKSYGVKSPDGRGFLKRKEDLEAFISTEAYSQLYMELAFDDVKAAEFINGVVPADVSQQKPLFPPAK